MFFPKGVPIDDCTYVPSPVAKYGAESENIAACTVGMDLSHFIMLKNELINKDPDVVP